MSVATADPSSATALAVRDFLLDLVPSETLGEPNFGPLGRVVYERTYSRDVYVRSSDGHFAMDDEGNHILQDWWRWSPPADGRMKENWAETCRRIALGSVALDETMDESAKIDEAVELFEHMFDFKLTPAGRHLWVTGTPSSFTRNCWSSPWGAKTSDHLRFGASRLFEGGGVGGNYSGDLMAMTSPILGTVTLAFSCDSEHPDYAMIAAAAGDANIGGAPISDAYVVEDSREGWVEAWCHLIDTASVPGRHHITFDVRNVRPFGAPLKTFGGTASGPAPLVSAIRGIAEELNRAGSEGRRLTGLEAMEIDHQVAAAVVAGGTRRSARMSLMSWDSPEIFDFIHCKNDPSKHWSTNISVEINDAFREALARGDEHAGRVATELMIGMARDGEPGIVDTGVINSTRDRLRGNDIRHVNPCAEATLEYEADADGLDGSGESCNLGSVNLDAFGTDVEGAKRAFELVGRFLYRATLKPYGDETAARIEARNRRIGAGFYGFQGWLAAHGTKMSAFPDDEARQRDLVTFRDAAYNAACEVADAHNLPRPISATAIAPTGSIAQLSGATSGINPVYSPYFIRRVRFGESDDAWKRASEAGYIVEKDVYAEHTMVVEYPTKDAILERYDEDLIEGSFDIDFGTYMRIVAAVQTTFCGGERGQAVSHTAQLRAGTNPNEMLEALRPLLGTLKGVTAFPEVSRPQSPLEAITKEEFIDYTQFREASVGDSNDGSCATGACPVV